MTSYEIEKEIIDIVCSIPIEQWDNKSADNVLQTLFKGKVIRLIKRERPDAFCYALINVDGIDIIDYSKKGIEMIKKINEYVYSQNELEYFNKIEDLYKTLST